LKLASEFVVPATPDKVFALFFDPDTMQACIPGCEELRQIDERTYQGRLANEVAHVKFRARFSVEILSVTNPAESDGRSVVQAVLKGEDRRLGSTIKINATMTIEARGEDALVSYELEMALWGKLGRLGESVIRRRTSEVEKRFATALAAVCAGEPIPRWVQRSGRSVASAAPPESVDVPVDAANTEPASPQRDPRDRQLLIAVTIAAFASGLVIGSRRRNHA
jgi:carbon monoxide dehydrogenase subunit G